MDLSQSMIIVGWFGLPMLAILQMHRARTNATERQSSSCQDTLTGGRACPECGEIPGTRRSTSFAPGRMHRRASDLDLEAIECSDGGPGCGSHTAPMRTTGRGRISYSIRGLLGGVLLVSWLAITIVIVREGGFSSESDRYDAMRAARAAQRQALERTTATPPPAGPEGGTPARVADEPRP